MGEKRLGEICRKFVYDKIGEEELYDHFRAKGEVSSDLCISETRDCRVGPKAPREEENAKNSAQTKKDKKPKEGKADVSGKSMDMDLATFIGKLAKKHGATKSEYTRKRSFSEWEQMVMEVSGR